jgi:hypothetical protein
VTNKSDEGGLGKARIRKGKEERKRLVRKESTITLIARMEASRTRLGMKSRILIALQPILDDCLPEQLSFA